MKITQHPRMAGVCVGDDVYCFTRRLFARVEEIFPAAVCVKVAILSVERHVDISISPQLWCADDIQNLSVCRYCGGREQLLLENETGIPYRICAGCRGAASADLGMWGA